MSSIKHIYFVRHGQSRSNVTGIREGAQTPLTKEGEKQAHFVAERFKNIPIEVVLSSEYKRARDTGKTIAELNNVPLESVPMAHERMLPDAVNGVHRDDPIMKEILEKFEATWKTDTSSADGEHFEDIKKRVIELSKVLEERPEQYIAVVSHGLFLKFFTGYHLLGETFTPEIFLNHLMLSMRSTNTGITYFAINSEKKWILSAWNDYAHLGEFQEDSNFE